jgi:hypothetical protein
VATLACSWRATPCSTPTSNCALDNRGRVAGSGRIDANLVNRGGNVGVQAFAGEVLTVGGRFLHGHTVQSGNADFASRLTLMLAGLVLTLRLARRRGWRR